ncbi:hypothetical protein ACFLTS_01875 [Chloroflexota bacterium]
MATNIDFQRIERKVWTSYFQDGLWDIFMGLLMLGLGVTSLTDERPAVYVIGYAIIALAVLVFSIGKRLITYPRIGRVKFGLYRKKKQRKVMIIVGLCVMLGLLGFVMGSFGLTPDKGLPNEIIALIVGIVFLAVFGSMAYFMDFNRMYAYGLLIAISIALVFALNNSAGSIAMCVSGSMTVLIGVLIAVRFTRKYPKVVKGDLDSDA